MRRSFGLIVTALVMIPCCGDSSPADDAPGASCVRDRSTNFSPTTEAMCEQVMASGPPEITVTIPATVVRGAQVNVAWTTKNVPANASIGFALVSDKDAGQGPIVLKTVPACATSTASTTWDAQSIGSAPTDAPGLYPTAQPGTYRAVATLFAESNVNLVGTRGSTQMPTPLLSATSNLFTITGTPCPER